MNEVMAFDSGKLAAAVRAGFGRALIEELASERYGIKFAPELGQMDWFKPALPMNNFKMAMDVQSELVTVSNSGIPSYLANFLDPRPIMILVSPLKAAIIAGERGIGDWLTESAQSITVEQTGETASYGDGMERFLAVYPAGKTDLPVAPPLKPRGFGDRGRSSGDRGRSRR